MYDVDQKVDVMCMMWMSFPMYTFDISLPRPPPPPRPPSLSLSGLLYLAYHDLFARRTGVCVCYKSLSLVT